MDDRSSITGLLLVRSTITAAIKTLKELQFSDKRLQDVAEQLAVDLLNVLNKYQPIFEVELLLTKLRRQKLLESLKK